jgi:hypothetical protein
MATYKLSVIESRRIWKPLFTALKLGTSVETRTVQRGAIAPQEAPMVSCKLFSLAGVVSCCWLLNLLDLLHTFEYFIYFSLDRVYGEAMVSCTEPRTAESCARLDLDLRVEWWTLFVVWKVS